MGTCSSAPLENDNRDTSNISKRSDDLNMNTLTFNDNIDEMDESILWNASESVLNLESIDIVMTQAERDNIRLRREIIKMQQQLSNRVKLVESRILWQYKDGH